MSGAIPPLYTPSRQVLGEIYLISLQQHSDNIVAASEKLLEKRSCHAVSYRST
jgi:hypothetical protein